jgi:hypothetical protein
MRTLIVALAFLALPAMVVAQQAEQAADITPPQVEMQQTTAPSSPASADVADAERFDRDQTEVQSQTSADAAVAQAGDPTQRGWWWVVGAIVVAGIILAVIL